MVRMKNYFEVVLEGVLKNPPFLFLFRGDLVTLSGVLDLVMSVFVLHFNKKLIFSQYKDTAVILIK